MKKMYNNILSTDDSAVDDKYNTCLVCGRLLYVQLQSECIKIAKVLACVTATAVCDLSETNEKQRDLSLGFMHRI